MRSQKVRVHTASRRRCGMNVRDVIVLLAVLLAGAAVSAHHGAAAYDRSVTLTLKATVTEFVFKNPHIIISFDAPDDNGKIVHWSAEGGSSSGLARRGWTWKTLKAGEQVTGAGDPEGRQGSQGDGADARDPSERRGRRSADPYTRAGRRSPEMKNVNRRVISALTLAVALATMGEAQI